METCKNIELRIYFIFSLETYLHLEKNYEESSRNWDSQGTQKGLISNHSYQHLSFNPAQAEEKQDEFWSAEPQTDSLAALTDQICDQSCFITYFAVKNYA